MGDEDEGSGPCRLPPPQAILTSLSFWITPQESDIQLNKCTQVLIGPCEIQTAENQEVVSPLSLFKVLEFILI